MNSENRVSFVRRNALKALVPVLGISALAGCVNDADAKKYNSVYNSTETECKEGKRADMIEAGYPIEDITTEIEIVCSEEALRAAKEALGEKMEVGS